MTADVRNAVAMLIGAIPTDVRSLSGSDTAAAYLLPQVRANLRVVGVTSA